MRNWEPFGGAFAALWAAMLATAFAFQSVREEAAPLPPPPPPPMIAWSEPTETAASDSIEMNGVATLTLDRPMSEPVEVIVEAAVDEKRQELRRIIPPGVETIDLFYECGLRNKYDSKTVTLTLLPATSYRLDAQTKIIEYPGQRVAMEFTAAPVQIDEGKIDQVEIQVSVTRAVTKKTTVNLSASGKAVADGLVRLSQHELVLSPGMTRTTATIERVKSLKQQNSEVTLRVSSEDDYDLKNPELKIPLIARPLPRIEILSDRQSMDEGSSVPIRIGAKPQGKLESPVSIRMRFLSQTAQFSDLRSEQFSKSTDQFVFDVQQPIVFAQLLAADDQIFLEGDETFELQFESVGQDAIISPSKMQFRIIDNDKLVPIATTVEGPDSIRFGGSPAKIAVQLRGDVELSQSLEIPYKLESQHLQMQNAQGRPLPSGGTITIPAGAKSSELYVAATDAAKEVTVPTIGKLWVKPGDLAELEASAREEFEFKIVGSKPSVAIVYCVDNRPVEVHRDILDSLNKLPGDLKSFALWGDGVLLVDNGDAAMGKNTASLQNSVPLPEEFDNSQLDRIVAGLAKHTKQFGRPDMTIIIWHGVGVSANIATPQELDPNENEVYFLWFGGGAKQDDTLKRVFAGYGRDGIDSFHSVGIDSTVPTYTGQIIEARITE